MLWWILSGTFALLACHPFATYPLSLMAARLIGGARPIASREPADLSVAMLCCAYNEERVIGDKLANALALQDAAPSTRLLFYTDGCTDRTAELIAGAAPRVTLIAGETRQGKSHGMNQLVAAAGDVDLLLFTDANVRVDGRAIEAVRRLFADPEIGCVCGHLVYVNPGESTTADAGARYWSFDEWLKRLETDTGSCVGADGSLFVIRRRLYRPVPADIIDDFYTSLSVWCAGWRVVISPDLVAWERSATRSREEFRRKIRIACRAFNCHRLLWSEIARRDAWDVYKYVSHKLLRWVSGVALALSAACLAIGLMVAGLSPWAIAALGGGLGALLWTGAAFRLRLPGLAWEAVLAVVATGLGVVASLRGRRFQTWGQPETTRQAGLG